MIVELGLCDHCNGGRVAAIDQDVLPKYGEIDDRDPDMNCTAVGCAPYAAICDAGPCLEQELGMYGTVPPSGVPRSLPLPVVVTHRTAL